MMSTDNIIDTVKRHPVTKEEVRRFTLGKLPEPGAYD